MHPHCATNAHSPCPGFSRTTCANKPRDLRYSSSSREELLRFLTDPQRSASHSQEERSSYLLLFVTDADRELKIPIHAAAAHRTLCEGRPAPLRKCKVMIRAFDRTYWFLVTTRHSNDCARNRSIYETTGFSWNGPLMVTRMERRSKRTPVGIESSEHHQAAIAAVERFVVQLRLGVETVLT